MNNFNLYSEIKQLEDQIYQMKEEIYFNNNFYKKYLNTQYAKYFIYHQNNIVLENEYKIKVNQYYKTTDNYNISSDIYKNLSRIELLNRKIGKYLFDN